MDVAQPTFYATACIGTQMNRSGRHFMNLVDGLLEILCRAVSEERDNNLTVKVVVFKERTDDHRRIVPPYRRTDKNHIVFVDTFRQIADTGTQVVVRFVLDTVAVIVWIRGIRFGRLDAINVRTGRRHDFLGSPLGIARSGKVSH